MLAAAKQQGAKPVMPTEPTGRTARRTGLVALLAALLAVPLALGAATYPRWSGSLMGIADWNGTQFSSAYPFPMILSGTGTGSISVTQGTSPWVTSTPGSPMQQTGGTVGPPAIVGYGVLSLTAVSTAMSTLTLSPNSGAWAVTGMVFIKNRSASASNAYVCPMAGVCTSAVGIELVPGQAYGFTNPASAMTVIAASTATVEAQW
jgi:hypothetical protein